MGIFSGELIVNESHRIFGVKKKLNCVFNTKNSTMYTLINRYRKDATVLTWQGSYIFIKISNKIKVSCTFM